MGRGARGDGHRISRSGAWGHAQGTERLGSCSVTFVFQLLVNNSLGGFRLRLIQSDWTWSPARNWEHEYHFDFGPSGEYGWREGAAQGRGEFFSTERLVDRMAMKLINAIRDKKTNRKSQHFITW